MPFRDLIGHRRLVVLLSESVNRESLPPSLIFSGPAGIGKRLAATATAQALNCVAPTLVENMRNGRGQQPAGASGPSKRPPAKLAGTPEEALQDVMDACGTCPACTRIARGIHPDVLVVEPDDSGSIKIEQVREVIEGAAYRPFEGRRRVVIFDEADSLLTSAQSALLKTLEEPPPSSVFFLVTSRPDMLLPTVRSRCCELRFRSLGPRDIAAALVRRGRSDGEAQAVAAVAGGSLGRALAASAGELVEAREVAERTLACAAASDDPRQRIEGAKNLLATTGAGGAADRAQLASYLRAMESLLRDVELLAARADVRALANADVQPAIERLARAFQGERGMRAFAAVDRALMALDRNAGVKVVADWLVLQL